MRVLTRRTGVDAAQQSMAGRFIPLSASKPLGVFNKAVDTCAKVVPFYGGEISAASIERQLLVAIPPGVTLELLSQHGVKLVHPDFFPLLDRIWLKAEARPGYYMMQVPGFSEVCNHPRMYDRPYAVEMIYVLWAWMQVRNQKLTRELLVCRDKAYYSGSHYLVDPVSSFTLEWSDVPKDYLDIPPVLADFRPFMFVTL